MTAFKRSQDQYVEGADKIANWPELDELCAAEEEPGGGLGRHRLEWLP